MMQVKHSSKSRPDARARENIFTNVEHFSGADAGAYRLDRTGNVAGFVTPRGCQAAAHPREVARAPPVPVGSR